MGLSFLQKINPAWFLAGAAFFLPIKPAPVNLFLLLAVVFAFFVTNVRKNVFDFFKHPVSIAAFALVAYLYLSAFNPYSDNALAQDYSTKYFRLLLIPVLAGVLFSLNKPARILDWFCIGAFLSVLASYGVIFGLLESDLPTYFKAYLTHNFFVAIACAWATYRIVKPDELTSSAWVRLLTGLAVLASLVNMFVFIPGRSGWITALLIPLLLGFRFLGYGKGLVLAIALGSMALLAFYTVDVVNLRVMQVFSEFAMWSAGDVQTKETSFGQRMLYWTISLEAIQYHPWLGYGLGGVKTAVEQGATARNFDSFINPHNQFLLLLLQGGLLALAAYALLLASILKTTKGNAIAWLTVFVYLINNLINSFHYDFAESLLFVLLVSLAIAQKAQYEKLR